MAIKKISITSIYVSDQDKAKEFYTDKLGFELVDDQDMGGGARWITVRPPGAETSIVLIQGYAGWTPEMVGKFGSIGFETDDIQGTYEELSSKGVKFTETPNLQYYGMWQAQFEDPDGNGYVIVAPQPK